MFFQSGKEIQEGFLKKHASENEIKELLDLRYIQHSGFIEGNPVFKERLFSITKLGTEARDQKIN